MKLEWMYFILCNGNKSVGTKGGIIDVKCPLQFQDHSDTWSLVGSTLCGVSPARVSCQRWGLPGGSELLWSLSK